MTETIPINSYYDHDDHGRVQVMDVSDGRVVYAVQGETVHVSGHGSFPKTTRESRTTFLDRTEPADLTLDPESEKVDGLDVVPG